MKKQSLPLSIFLLILFFTLSVNGVEARSGCCSWHGGVCGCSCCDGTALSATCAPYYPNCNEETVPPPTTTTTTVPPTTITTTVPPSTTTTTTTTITTTITVPIVPILPKSTEPKIETPEIKIEENNELEAQKSLKQPTSEKLTAQVYKEDRGISVWLWILGIGAVLFYFIYKFRKKTK